MGKGKRPEGVPSGKNFDMLAHGGEAAATVGMPRVSPRARDHDDSSSRRLCPASHRKSSTGNERTRTR